MANYFYKRFIFKKFAKHSAYFCRSNLYHLYNNALTKFIIKSAVIIQTMAKRVLKELYYTILIPLFFFHLVEHDFLIFVIFNKTKSHLFLKTKLLFSHI